MSGLFLSFVYFYCSEMDGITPQTDLIDSIMDRWFVNLTGRWGGKCRVGKERATAKTKSRSPSGMTSNKGRFLWDDRQERQRPTVNGRKTRTKQRRRVEAKHVPFHRAKEEDRG